MKRKEMETRNDENSQVTLPTWKLRMEEMLNDGLHSDATFVTDDGTKILAHRNILASVSPVFRAMFASSMIEETTRAVQIADMSSSCLRAFLCLLYTEELERQVCAEFGLHLLAACHKYQTPPHLIEMVSSLVSEMITVENSITVFEYGSLYDDETLLSCSKSFIFRNWEQVLNTPEFGVLAVKNPKLQAELVRSFTFDELIKSDQLMEELWERPVKGSLTHKLWEQAKKKALVYHAAREDAYKALREAYPAYKAQIQAHLDNGFPI